MPPQTGTNDNQARRTAGKKKHLDDHGAKQAADLNTGNLNLGRQIRSMRLDRGWKLTDLSKLSGIAVSTLSKIENGLLALKYDRLQQVAHAFDMSLSEFLATQGSASKKVSATARISWAKDTNKPVIETQGGVDQYLCDELYKKRMVPVRHQCLARTLEEFGPMLRHPGEEFIFILKGLVEVHTEFYESKILKTGESVYFDSQMGHALLNAGKGEAWIISVNCTT